MASKKKKRFCIFKITLITVNTLISIFIEPVQGCGLVALSSLTCIVFVFEFKVCVLFIVILSQNRKGGGRNK